MVSTRVGYAGGTTDRPTYHDVGDHREAVEVRFDPGRISYARLLEVYWSGRPTNVPPGPEGRVELAILSRGEAQRRAAEAAIAARRRETGERVYVDLLPDAAFWPAERLHQKFDLQRTHPLLVRELAASFPDLDAFLASTAAGRLNSYLGPFGDEDGLAEAARELGWDVEALRRRLREPEAAR